MDINADLAEKADAVIQKFINYWDHQLSQKILFSERIENFEIPIRNIYEKKNRNKTDHNNNPGLTKSTCMLKISNWLAGENLSKFIHFEHPFLDTMVMEAMGHLKNWHQKSAEFCQKFDVSSLKQLTRSWDIENWVTVSTKLGHFDLVQQYHPDIYPLIINLSKSYTPVYQKFSNKSQKILIHQDLSPSNILGTADLKITGIIDYNNSMISWPIVDVAIYLAALFTRINKDITAKPERVACHSLNTPCVKLFCFYQKTLKYNQKILSSLQLQLVDLKLH